MTASSETGKNLSGVGAEGATEPRRDESAQDSALDTNTVIGGAPGATGGEESVQVGEKIGKYEIRARLGSGGMGAVYLAFDPMIEREVALKVLSPNLHSSPTALQRFLGEARAIGRLNHPNVVSVYDIDQWNGQYFLVMELISGGSVSDRVSEGRLPWEEACRITIQAARGLSAAHDAGMIHRDIKPENLMLTKDGTVKVVDFGLSKLLDAAQDSHNAVTAAGQILGTPQYMSPEQFEANEVDSRTDIYSLGATLFRLLTSRFPYHECRTILQVMTAHTTQPAPVPTEFESSIPQAINRIIARSMAKKAADRYATAAQMADELEQLLRKSDPAALRSAEPETLSDRPLESVLIVEPSKLQGAMLKDAFAQAKVPRVQVTSTLQVARTAVSVETPDLLLTAMQLSDGQGIDFLRDLCSTAQMERSTVVLNSSDVTPEELVGIGSSACLMLAPKKARADDILRVAHATGPSIVTHGDISSPVDPAAIRLQIVLDAGRIPDVMADLLREMQILDVDISVNSQGEVAVSPLVSLVLLLRRNEVPGGHAGMAGLTRMTGESAPMTAVAQVEQGQLVLRAVRRQGIVAICQRPLNAARMTCLLQGCRL